MADPAPSLSSADLQQGFLKETQSLAAQGLPYTWGNWDCSGTTRRLYERVAGINIGQTASDQFVNLYRQGKVAGPPRDGSGQVNSQALAREMKPGDLIFFSNTYRPDPSRGSDVTHVMIYLGQNEKGQMLMSGSQQSHGACNPAGSGPDIYVFDPNQTKGGYQNGLGRVKGQFCGFGRPMGSLQDHAEPTARLNVAMPEQNRVASAASRAGEWLGGKPGQALSGLSQFFNSDTQQELKMILGFVLSLVEGFLGKQEKAAAAPQQQPPQQAPAAARAESRQQQAPAQETAPAPAQTVAQERQAAPQQNASPWQNAQRSWNIAPPGAGGQQITVAG
ncbi:MAG: NlpC/P60 family protein [Verrucomicrobium sp.]|nr:NlpC/P60 family protein [Verrucomicrobium sp.]